MAVSPSGSAFLFTGFVAFTVLVAAGVIWNVYLAGRGLQETPRRTWLFTGIAAMGIALWMLLTWEVAATGIVADFERRPPPMLISRCSPPHSSAHSAPID